MSPDPAVHPIQLLPGFRHAWALFVAVGVLNLVLLQNQFRRRIAERPDLAAGYQWCLAAHAAFLLLPWLVMGYGIEVGGVPTPFAFLNPPGNNPYILAFYGVDTCLIVLACVWVCLYRGAEFLVAHPGTLGRSMPTNPTMLRAYAALAFVAWLIVLVLRWKHFLPEAPFT